MVAYESGNRPVRDEMSVDVAHDNEARPVRSVVIVIFFAGGGSFELAIVNCFGLGRVVLPIKSVPRPLLLRGRP